jgi:Protein of unknown function (DUF1549)/Protein of unknown function (DUF1553)/Bacterial Ig-like domain
MIVPRLSRGVVVCALWAVGLSSVQGETVASLSVTPSQVVLRGPMAQQRLIVTGNVDGRLVDLTRDAAFRSATPDIVGVDSHGLITPKGDGSGVIEVNVGGQRAQATVRVAGTGELARPTFELDVMPILTRAGCNAGACHGKARGQNGFQLSLLGFDPNFDYGAITQEARGRRVFPAAPEQSLLLLKPTTQIAHGGGLRLELGGRAYEILSAWIAQGMPRSPASAPKLERISVEPKARVMCNHEQQQTVVTAHYTNGSAVDVTHLAAFQSNESAIVAVDESGKIQAGPIPGEAAITARFEGQFATCDVTIPLPDLVPAVLYASLPKANFIDGLVWEKLRKLGLTPSAPAPETTFFRRAYLDAIGRLPTPDETRAFLADTSLDKRTRLVDHLLEQPEYADHWANKWMDMLRPNPYRVGIKAVLNLDAWIRQAFRENRPYDQFVREVVTAKGSTFRDGAVTVFRDRREPEEAATIFSQLFLGIRLECARCHHHPFEVWGQDDFYGFAAYFARIGRKGRGLSPPISGSEEIVFTAKSGSVKHPLTGDVLPPKPLFGKAPQADDPDADPREALAGWITSPDNPYFARVVVNRVWGDLLARGLVEPVDDLRATNPPTNGPLLDALADDFRTHGYDLKHLIRTIMTSYVYGLSSVPNERNAVDTRNYSRHYRQRLRAEALLDAICDITEVPENYSAAPPGSRATAIWTHRTPSVFLDTFGRPDPNQDPPCERIEDTSVVQALHLMNAPTMQSKVTNDAGRAARLAASGKSNEEIVEELYLLTYCRLPTDEERSTVLDIFEPGTGSRREAVEDLLWALLNTPEFVFKD